MTTYSIPTNHIFGQTYTLRAAWQLHYNAPTNRAPWISAYARQGGGYEYIPVANLAVGDRLQDARHTWEIMAIGPEIVEQVELHETNEDRTYSGLVKTGQKSGQTAQYIELKRVA